MKIALGVLKTNGNIYTVKTDMRSDRRLTLKVLNVQLNLNRFTVYQILTYHFQKVCAEMVPHNPHSREEEQSIASILI